MLNYYKSLPSETLATLQACFEQTEGMISFEEAELLYRLAKDVQDGCIMEVGSYRGRSSVFLGRGSLDGAGNPVYAVDPHKEFVGVLGGVFGPQDRTAFYKAMLNNGCSEIVALINLSSECFANTWKDDISLLWIDGDHSYEGVKRDFLCWRPHLKRLGLVAFDDAVDPDLGPFQLIDELVESGGFQKVAAIGKVVVLQKC